MGANLVTQVLAHWTHLSDRAFRVLVRMAVTALDNPSPKQPAAIYHGGRELLAMSLRSKGGTERTRYRSVAEAVAELTEAGAIEHLAIGWAGQNAVYRLTLGNTRPAGMDGPSTHPLADDETPDDQGMGGTRAHPMDGSTAHPMDVPSARKWMGPGHTPRNQEEITKERDEEEMGFSPPTSHPPRATAEPTKPGSPPRPTKCPHGIKIQARADGTSACAVCRREQRAGPPDPDPPPDRPPRCRHGLSPTSTTPCAGCLADRPDNVIDLDSRRAS